MSAFELLHKDIQKAVWDLGWKEFRYIQTESIKAVINSNKDVIISAPTSSGKTEAAFLPILSDTREELDMSLSILYVSPLKALINDQFSRVSDLCRKMDIVITKWHGDANQAKKKKLLEKPRGVLLITPESLESLLVNREAQARRLFENLKYVVIDEVHAFAGAPRGDQLKSILTRIENLNGIITTKIALSATIGSMSNIAKWLGSENPVEIIDKESGKGIRGSIRTFRSSEENNLLVKSLVERSTKGKNLFFANSKRILEELCLKTKAESRRPEIIDIHHGSLDKAQRETVEKNLKESPSFSVFCTNTLELGIDIGDVDEVTLLSPPWSMASFVQKIGRSGRKEGRDISFNFSFNETPKKSDSHVFDNVNWSLIKSISLIELLLEGWCEEGSFLTPGYSTMVHQVIAYIAQKRAVKADAIYNNIINDSFNKKIDVEQFKALLNFLCEKKIVAQDNTGEIVLSVAGEKLTENYDFLSVFISPEVWSIVSNGSKIGAIPLSNMYRVGDNLVLGGRLWSVEALEYSTKRINVKPSSGGKVPLFDGSGGVVHQKIHQKMIEVLLSEEMYAYLYEGALEELRQSRKYYKELLNDKTFFPIFFGTKVANTLWATIKNIDPEVANFDFCLLFSSPIENIASKVSNFEISLMEYMNTDEDIKNLTIEKFDYLLPEDLRIKSLINQFFDFELTKKFIKTIT